MVFSRSVLDSLDLLVGGGGGADDGDCAWVPASCAYMSIQCDKSRLYSTSAPILNKSVVVPLTKCAEAMAYEFVKWRPMLGALIISTALSLLLASPFIFSPSSGICSCSWYRPSPRSTGRAVAVRRMRRRLTSRILTDGVVCINPIRREDPEGRKGMTIKKNGGTFGAQG